MMNWSLYDDQMGVAHLLNSLCSKININVVGFWGSNRRCRSSESECCRYKCFHDDGKMEIAEIKGRMRGIHVYRMSDSSGSYSGMLPEFDSSNIDLQLNFFNYQQARQYFKTHRSSFGPQVFVSQTPLADIFFYDDHLYNERRIRLVPEVSQYKNAIHTLQFESQFESLIYIKGPNNVKYRVAFLHKEDLEKVLARFSRSKHSSTTHHIQVTTLENIILGMQDCSTSKCNDVIIVGPGMITP